MTRGLAITGRVKTNIILILKFLKDLDVLAEQLSKMGGNHLSKAGSPPPPAPPPRESSIASPKSVDEDNESLTSPGSSQNADGTLLASEPAKNHRVIDDSTLKGLKETNSDLPPPNKPLPPTPTDQSPSSETPGDDGTLVGKTVSNKLFWCRQNCLT